MVHKLTQPLFLYRDCNLYDVPWVFIAFFFEYITRCTDRSISITIVSVFIFSQYVKKKTHQWRVAVFFFEFFRALKQNREN